ncbi:MAG: DUF2344 domain-containing protein, partial [Deltaproteobacteria bacterium]|nr:DUF2344 domain-containing protein [Deltaproteobacteria bacterium]
SSGFHPMPRIIFYDALPVGMESLDETCDIELISPMAAQTVIERTAPCLPEGIHIKQVQEIALKSNPVAGKIRKYLISFPESPRICVPDVAARARALQQLSEAESFPVRTQKKGKPVDVDVKSHITSLQLNEHGDLLMELPYSVTKLPKAVEIVTQLLDLDEQSSMGLHIIKLGHS